MTKQIAGISDEAVEAATGSKWDHWITLLDEHEGTDLTHKERVAVIAKSGVESGWWQQQLAVGYEHERGLREVGETADAGYQVGAQRTYPISRDQLWKYLTNDAGIARWAGAEVEISFHPGEQFKTADGTTGEIRTMKEEERIRMTWQPADRDRSTTLQLTCSAHETDANKSVLRIHHERLENSAAREAMGQHWRSVLDQIGEDLRKV